MPVYTYTSLNDPSATTGTKAFGINDAGQIVGGYDAGSIGTVHGFLLSGGTYTTLDDPGTDQTQLSRINNAGEIAGFYFTPGIQGMRPYTRPAHPISCCATSTPARSRCTILRATPLSERPASVRSDWIGSSAVLLSILQADRRVTQVRSPNSRKQWQALLVAVAQARA
jgi:probable HAF family extracellular repeat protein